MSNPAVSLGDEPPDLRRLQHFLCVAECAGFSRAAQQLHLSQQALSSSIAKLEKQLDTKLFDRTGRRISLTPAGVALQEGATGLLAAGQILLRQVRDAAAANRTPFVVAHTPAITADEVHTLLAPVRIGRPDVSLTVAQTFPSELESALVHGSVDVALRRGVAVPHGLAAAVIGYHPLRVAVAASHPLATAGTLTLDRLRHERIVVWAPPGASFYTDFILSTCRRAGFEPGLVVDRVQGTPPVTAVVDYPDAVAFVTAPAGPALGGRVRVLDLADPPMTPIQALWLPHTRSAVRDLLTTVTSDRTDSRATDGYSRT
ncbi:LysR family transcriptional regulator [Nocardia veterana]|uniref:LysR family transcriptional regulator n=1 Tax=Nocardia veterana TaxID=132249 RepID=A0A7X6LVT6_9NOCA|nr:LysR family transcriptional regulator [Nocardia veterana]NKY85066.1 LysR family transcriptional regulator [Nocardia veterana]